MKTKKILTVVIAILAFAVTNSYSQNLPSYVPTNGIGGYWGFNSNANDESSNGNNGTIINGASLCDGRSGVLNNAFDFDGINGQINVNHSSSISPLNYLTISAWIFPRVYEDNKHCVSKGSHLNLDYRSYSIIGPQSNGKWMFTLNAGGSETQLESNSNAILNQWSLITVVYDGNQMYLYINGTLDNQTIKTGTINQTTEGLTFGSHIFYSYSDYWFNGKVDDIAIYNRALSQPEIIQLFTANQATDAFITTWVTDVNNETLTLPTQPDASNYTIDWGDGSATNTYTATQAPSHTYNNIGEHTVSITGTFPHLKFVEQIKLKAVQQWGTQKWTSMANMFQSCALLNSFPSQAPDLSLCTNMYQMFYDTPFNQPIGSWNVSQVTNMQQMFMYTPFNQPIGDWDVSQVTNMYQMFFGTPFNQPIGNWNVSNVSNMFQMFMQTPFNQPIGDWDVSKITSMYQMFYGTPFNQPISNWDMSHVTDMQQMFMYTPFNQPIGDWDVSQVTNMYQMFYETPFNKPIGNWNVSQVTNMQQMFMLTPFNQSIEDWDVSQVTNMYQMFYGTPFNQPIGNWNVGNVSNMFQIFMQTPFNQPIGDWDVSKITSMYQMFYGTPFNQLISNWDVSHVTDMQQMFMYTPFNQPIGDWDVSQVTNMYQMFYAAPFNKPIGNWNVSQVTNMEQMFMLTPFNQSIGNWDISQVTNMYQMLYGTNLSTVNYDATLIGWAARAANSGVKQMVTFSAGNSNYCNGVVARDYLTNNFGWNITDGGVDCISFSTESIQSFCGSATVGSLAATGSELNWFSTAIGGLALASDTPLVTGNYFVSQTINSIESARTEVAVTISPQVTPTFAPIASTCSGFNITALPTTSNNGITGTWSPAINNNVTTTYTFTPNEGQCAATTTQTISITNPFITSEISFEAPQVTAASLLNVTVGTQIWTNKNLDIATYRDGTPIPQVTDPNQWANPTTGAWCYYNNDPANGEVYGKLYNWYAVAGIYDAASLNDTTLRKQFAPTGYHVPTDAEWTSLTTFLGSESVAGGMMKETSTELWNSPNQDANNSSGFTGLPGGYRVYDGAFGTIGGYGSWWSSSEYDTTVAWARSLGYWYGSAGRNLNVKTYGFSVRLIKD